MRVYETMVIIDPDLESEDVEKVVDEIRAVIEKNSGSDISVDIWGKRRLQFPILKKESGHYAVLDYKGEPDLVMELDRVLKLRDDVLRFKTLNPEGS